MHSVLEKAREVTAASFLALSPVVGILAMQTVDHTDRVVYAPDTASPQDSLVTVVETKSAAFTIATAMVGLGCVAIGTCIGAPMLTKEADTYDGPLLDVELVE